MKNTITCSRALTLGLMLFAATILCSIDSSAQVTVSADGPGNRSEERRVGKEC